MLLRSQTFLRRASSWGTEILAAPCEFTRGSASFVAKPGEIPAESLAPLAPSGFLLLLISAPQSRTQLQRTHITELAEPLNYKPIRPPYLSTQ